MNKRGHMPIILDRLAKTLDAHGVKLKRNQLLEIAAAAFGYHNQNEATAAFRGSPLQPAELMGRTDVGGEEMLILRDPIAGANYAISHSFIEQVVEVERAERIGITPYGHLVDISEIGACEAPEKSSDDLMVHIGLVFHRHGHDVFTARTQQGLEAEIATYARQFWNEARSTRPELPEDDGEMDDDAVISAYFDAVEGEWIDRHVERIGTQEREAPSAGNQAQNVNEGPVGAHSEHILRHDEEKPLIKGYKLESSRDGDDVVVATLVRMTKDPDAEKEIGKAAACLDVLNDVMATRRYGIDAEKDGEIKLRLPCMITIDSKDMNDWHAAIRDLFSPEGKRIMATFHPQAWFNDYAIEVDPQGDTDFDITFEMLAIGQRACELEDNDYESDHLSEAVRAPEWIRKWQGPFWIEITR